MAASLLLLHALNAVKVVVKVVVAVVGSSEASIMGYQAEE